MNITTTAFKRFLKESRISLYHVSNTTNTNANTNINTNADRRIDNGNNNDQEPHRLASEIVIFYQTQEIERFRVQNGSLRFINDRRQEVIVDQRSIIATKDWIIDNRNQILASKDRMIDNRDQIIAEQDRIIAIHQQVDIEQTELINSLRGMVRSSLKLTDDHIRVKDEWIIAQREEMYRFRNVNLFYYVLAVALLVILFLPDVIEYLCSGWYSES